MWDSVLVSWGDWFTGLTEFTGLLVDGMLNCLFAGTTMWLVLVLTVIDSILHSVRLTRSAGSALCGTFGVVDCWLA